VGELGLQLHRGARELGVVCFRTGLLVPSEHARLLHANKDIRDHLRRERIGVAAQTKVRTAASS
jgi:hypothetical protein